jgi:hypothetical protein
MSPILTGVIASGISGNLIPPTNFESIATVNFTGSSATATFSSIPSTYKHLQLRILARIDYAGSYERFLRLRFNGSTSGYVAHYLTGDGSSVTAGAETGLAHTYIAEIPTNGWTTGIFGVGVVDILDYASTNKNKTTRSITGFDANGSGYIRLVSGLWQNNIDAVNQIQVISDLGNYISGSQIALYGIRGN